MHKIITYILQNIKNPVRLEIRGGEHLLPNPGSHYLSLFFTKQIFFPFVDTRFSILFAGQTG